eukprot:TRINITY_DN14394_c0_g1_i1.p1 TRINITY_DN14394_c0_g1~~TRINITY_DN14394_c0_g1_i1.p1  ORF type:complete len:112 (-),score=12.47 TRINITY_DN14394_c0_g1_i1:92-427(-)
MTVLGTGQIEVIVIRGCETLRKARKKKKKKDSSCKVRECTKGTLKSGLSGVGNCTRVATFCLVCGTCLFVCLFVYFLLCPNITCNLSTKERSACSYFHLFIFIYLLFLKPN